MKKLYILGNFKNEGTFNNDSSDLDLYMELGWEVFTTGFWAKLNLDNNSWVCTHEDRLFMYEHITKNLIPWKDLNKEEYDEVVYIYQQKFSLLRIFNESEWSDEMRKAISKNNLKEVKNKNYVCVQIRNRDHCTWRNGNIDEWNELILKLSKKHDIVYVVGKGNENKIFPENIKIINNLKNYAELIHSDNCVASYGSSSGLMSLNYIYGRRDLPVNILYTEDFNAKLNNHILFFGDKTNVANITPKFFFNLKDMIESI